MPAWIAATSSGVSGLRMSTPSTSAAKQGPIWRVMTGMAPASLLGSDHRQRSARRRLPLRGVVAVEHRGPDVVAQLPKRGQRVMHDRRVPEDLRKHVAIHVLP